MTENELSAYIGWKSGSLILAQLDNWPIVSESHNDALPKWQKLSNNLKELYNRDDITPNDAQIWDSNEAVTEDMKALAIAVRKVRNGRRRATARLQKNLDGRPEAGSPHGKVKKELRILNAVTRQVKDTKIASKARAQAELKAIEDVQKQVLERKIALKTILKKDNAAKTEEKTTNGSGKFGKGSGSAIVRKAGVGLLAKDSTVTSATGALYIQNSEA